MRPSILQVVCLPLLCCLAACLENASGSERDGGGEHAVADGGMADVGMADAASEPWGPLPDGMIVVESPPDMTPMVVPNDPKYHEHVAPILKQRCTSGCHQPGGIAPFSLVTYAQAKPLAGGIKAATASRSMPPFGVDNSGACNTYVGARWLTQEEITILGAWADGGAQEGDPASALPPPGPPSGLPRVDATLDTAIPYSPTAGDDYRCFVVNAPAPVDAYLTAFEVRPGYVSEVHHIVMFTLDAAGEAQAMALDQQELGPGYTCFGGAGVSGATPVGVWTPGVRVVSYPPNTGLRLPGGRKMVVQIHYNTLNGVFPDRTYIDLMGSVSVAKPAGIYIANDPALSLPPGQADVGSAYALPFAGLPSNATIYGIQPHMHLRGKSMRIDVEKPGGASSCAMNVPAYDFHWQEMFFYQIPLTVTPSDTLKVSCRYNTIGATGTTTYGERTTDEMCVGIVYYAL